MSRRAGETPLAALLPGSIRDDATIAAAAASLDPIRRVLAGGIPNILLWARLDPTPGYLSPSLQRLVNLGGGLKPLIEAELELLAWQLHVDFRETAATPAQLAALVRNAIPWHRIKGTPASIKAALALCGYTGITLEESGEGDFWAAYQLGLSGVTGMDDLARIVTICREMQPARCRLWRVYTPEYDFRPGVWSGPLPVCAWSQCWWSAYSGAEAPDIPGLDDDTGLVVSFGSRRGVLVTPLCGEQGRAALLLTLNQPGTNLPSHCDMKLTTGVDMTAGSLGQGLSAAIGMALAARMDHKDYRVYCIVGDGEQQEGQIWEAAMYAGSQELDNLVVLVDDNGMQIDGYTDALNAVRPLEKRWEAFGWAALRVDGHNFAELEAALKHARTIKKRPTAIIMSTVKGKGISVAEGKLGSHNMPLSPEDVAKSLQELQ